MKLSRPELPRTLHVLTAIHALGALACFVMAAGSAGLRREAEGAAHVPGRVGPR